MEWKVKERGLKATDAIKTAEVLLNAGLDINQEAFREENPEFRATPLWYAIAHGQNFKLAEFLLKRGSVPHYCMWAAAYNDDAPAIRLLVGNGAEIMRRKRDPEFRKMAQQLRTETHAH